MQCKPKQSKDAAAAVNQSNRNEPVLETEKGFRTMYKSGELVMIILFRRINGKLN